MGDQIEFGYNPPTFASEPGPDNPGPNDFDTPFYSDLRWEDVKQAILYAEDLGFDAVWAPDHFHHGVDNAILECWTLLSWAAATTDMRVGPLVACNDYRNPALLANMAATLDVISDGRLTLGIGCGWFEEEYEAYGWEFRDAFERLMRLDEGIRVIRQMWEHDGATFEGEYYQIEEAYCNPGPVQSPYPPIMVGGGGEDVTLKLVAKLADRWNYGGPIGTYSAKVDVLYEHCEEVGRDDDEIELTWDGHVICSRDDAEIDRILDRALVTEGDPTNEDDLEILSTLENVGDLEEVSAIVGTPEECISQLQSFVDLGVTGFQCWFVDYPRLDGIELFADEVMPAFR